MTLKDTWKWIGLYERSRECWRDCGTVFGAAVVDRTERLADKEVRAAVVFFPLFRRGLWISAQTLIALKSEEWRQQDGEMDEAQLSLVILKVEERVVFWNLVLIGAGFATELLRGSLLIWICGF